MVKGLEEGAGQGKNQHVPSTCYNLDLLQGRERRAGVEDAEEGETGAGQTGRTADGPGKQRAPLVTTACY